MKTVLKSVVGTVLCIALGLVGYNLVPADTINNIFGAANEITHSISSAWSFGD